LLKPEGKADEKNGKYRGNRDTEPRAAVIVRELELRDLWKARDEAREGRQGESFSLDIAFCQLETIKEEPRVAKDNERELEGPASEERQREIEELVERWGLHDEPSERPAALLGDFNARIGTPELKWLVRHAKFRFAGPAGAPPSGTPDLTMSEKDQWWPYTHLKHGILIDHAFIRGFDQEKWRWEARAIVLPHDEAGGRASDHRPIALTIRER
jgi:hypothetical protein